MFYCLRSSFLNPDAVGFADKFAWEVPRKGAYATHDEMLEFYLHTKMWSFMNRHFGWSVVDCYQVSSSVAGGLFVYWLMSFCRIARPGASWIMFWLCLSGGFVQLFFGDVENYTLVTAVLMAYFLASLKFLRAEGSLVAPAATLALAMAFHLLAGFLLPSLAYLVVVSWSRRERRPILASGFAFFGILAGVVAYLHFDCLHISKLWYNSHAFAHGGHFGERWVKPSWEYHRQILNLSLFLFPCWILVPPTLRTRNWTTGGLQGFLLVASASMSILLLFWNAMLGAYNDWNLFAPVGLPISLLCWYGLTAPETMARRLNGLKAFGCMFGIHTAAWVLSNHLAGS